MEGIIILLIIASLVWVLYLVRQDTRMINSYLAKIEKMLSEILKHKEK